MSLRPPRNTLKRHQGFEDGVRLVVAVGSPLISQQEDPETYQEARSIFERTGRLDAALERIALPIVPGGYQRRELFRPILQLAILWFLIVMLLVFSGSSWVPSLLNYYDEVNQPRPLILKGLMWFLSTGSIFFILIEFAFVVLLLLLAFGSRFKIPMGLPGGRHYEQACNRYHEARYRAVTEPGEFWPLIQRISQSQAIFIASMWRQSLPWFIGLVIGGGLVFVYSFVLFLPIVQLIKDMSLPNVISGRPW